METNTSNIYLFKALDAYPFQLEEAIEALNYALSYDEKNVKALCLMANVQADQLGDYETAKIYFEAAIANQMEMPNIYPDYIDILIRNEDFEEAAKLLDYALNMKATDKGVLYLLQGYLFEAQGKHKEAFKSYKQAKMRSLNVHFTSLINSQIERVKKKFPKKKKDKKKNKKIKRKEKKNNRSKKK